MNVISILVIIALFVVIIILKFSPRICKIVTEKETTYYLVFAIKDGQGKTNWLEYLTLFKIKND